MDSVSVGKTPCRVILLLVAALPACSLAGSPEPPAEETARRRSFETGVRALERGDHDEAMSALAPVAAICPMDVTGRRALLLLAAAELDPRNGDGRPDAAAELAAFQLGRLPDGDADRTLAAELYLLALDRGATPIGANELPGARVIWERYLGDGVATMPLGASQADTLAVAAAAGTDGPEGVEIAPPGSGGGPRCDVPAPVAGVVMPELTGEPLVVRLARPPVAAAAPATGGSQDAAALAAEVDRLREELARKDQELDRIRRTLRP